MKHYLFGLFALALVNCTNGQNLDQQSKKINQTKMAAPSEPTQQVEKTEEQWKKELTPEQFYILRQKGTERAFTGKYWNHKEKGTYACAACGQELFTSEQKYDSGCGWPSFYAAVGNGRVITQVDRSHGMVRTEIMCGNCKGHLGHVFDDGPEPTGLRYCVNSVSIDFKKVELKK
ncbi:MAG: peptide-methionine (R)-S-oxide reductase MsrB [Bernardetiaceae bacterium]|jgi:peptide-methionine (R)-S-oxide reductase|nr:peptide-methionine (R)-S-oxide reductase MsrB [Bernardetiaceae bacterium]